MIYIPPYCHFLSPLDNGAFGALVQWLRRNYYYAQRVGIVRAMERGIRHLNVDVFVIVCFCESGKEPPKRQT